MCAVCVCVCVCACVCVLDESERKETAGRRAHLLSRFRFDVIRQSFVRGIKWN